MDNLVLDNSVIMKWFVVEQDSSAALHYLDQHKSAKTTVAAPKLLIYEFINGLQYHKANLDLKEITRFVKNLFSIEISFIDLEENGLSTTVFYARKFSISTYDATHITLAEKLH